MSPTHAKRLLSPSSAVLASAAFLALAPLLGGEDGVQIPHTFQAGTKALASEVNENFDAVAAAIDAIPQPANRIVVANEGGEFTSVAAALASITDAADDNPYLVQVAPGVYTETSTGVVPSFVSLVGSGAAVTTIRGAITSSLSNGSSAVVQLQDLAGLSDLTVENTGASGISSGVFGAGLSRATRIADCVVRTTSTGGTGHFGVLLNDSDATLVDCVLQAEGATLVNSAFACSDSAGPFSQPLLIDCVLEAKAVNSGFGLQLVNTAADVQGCKVEGWFRALSASVAGISLVRDCEMRTLGFSPVYEQTGSATVLSATTFFVGGNPTGVSSQFKYVHCIKANYDPVVDGTGSAVQ